MITLNEKQESEYEESRKLLLKATSIKEVNYHATKIHKILDEAEKDNPNTDKRFTEEQSKQLKEYREKLLATTDIEEINYYGHKIMNIIDKTPN